MEEVRLTFLGTGTSQGVPIIGCRCEVCRSDDEHDKRFRSSVLVETGGLKILVDAGPDFRSQMLRKGIDHLDAILLTHNHKDHTGGLDDIRALNYIDKRTVDIYCEENVLDSLRIEYPYAFAEHKYPGAPEWKVRLISDKEFYINPDLEKKELVWVHDVGYGYMLEDGSIVPTGSDVISAADTEAVSDMGVKVVPIRGYHDKMPVLGFRFGKIAYITDMSSLPETEFEKLKGLEHLTLNTVGYKHHHSHFSLDQALEIADKIGARHTWLTHLSHSFPKYKEFCKELKTLCKERKISSEVLPAYDGLEISAE